MPQPSFLTSQEKEKIHRKSLVDFIDTSNLL